MSSDDGRSATCPEALPREFVHDLRNHLGVAIATADLLSLSALEAPQARDLEKIRDACLRAVAAIDRWDRVSPALHENCRPGRAPGSQR